MDDKEGTDKIIKAQAEKINELSAELFKKETDLIVERFTVRIGLTFAVTVIILGAVELLIKNNP